MTEANTEKQKRGYIYIIKHNDETLTDCYIGSTKNFSSRKSRHKKCVMNRRGKTYHSKIYKHIRHHGGWLNFTMVVIHVVWYRHKRELLAQEQFVIDSLLPTLNTIRASKHIQTELELLPDEMQLLSI